MLTIKTKLGKSDISGIGLFADQFIPQGTIVWKFMPNFDLLLSEDEIQKLSESAQKQFYNYAYLDKKYNKYVLCSDDARFFNHSDNPNCDDGTDDVTIALRDINEGEELTIDYKDCYADIERHPEIITVGKTVENITT
jgi:SET domain-containing protein